MNDRMVKTAVYSHGQCIGHVLWSGKDTEVPVNISRYHARHGLSWDVEGQDRSAT
jgi:hypothetical protein